jgi:TPR repeat protein
LFDSDRDLSEAIEYLKNAANQNHSKASYLYGLILRDGIGVEQDIDKSRIYLGQAAECHDVNAQFALAELLRETRHDLGTAARYYKGLADRTDVINFRLISVSAMRWYGVLLHHGEGIDQDINQSQLYLTRATAYGDPLAQYELGELFFQHRLDYQRAAFLFTLAAFQGHDEACYRLAMMIRNGDIDYEDSKRQFKIALLFVRHSEVCDLAESYFKRAADQDMVEAMYFYALLPHKLADDVEHHQKERWMYLEWAANKGYAPAQFWIGQLLLCEVSDGTRAVHYLRLAAFQDHPEAKSHYQNVVLKGLEASRSIIRNSFDAKRCLKAAVDQAIAEAMMEYGHSLVTGNEYAQHFDEGIHYLQLAADSGHPNIQAKVAELFVRFSHLHHLAVYYFKLAIDQGNIQAKTGYFQMLLANGLIIECIKFLQQRAAIGDYESEKAVGNICLKYPKEAGRIALSLETKAHQNDPVALYNLGMMLLNGWGTRQDRNIAIQYLKRAANFHHAPSQWAVSVFLVNEVADCQSGRLYCKLAADQRFPIACLMHSFLIFSDHRLEGNVDQCLQCAWWAADSGVTTAKGVIAAHLFARNESSTAEWYLQSFLKTAKLVQLRVMIVLCLSGSGVPFNPRIAITCAIAPAAQENLEISTLLRNFTHAIGLSHEDANWQQQLLKAAEERDPRLWFLFGTGALQAESHHTAVDCLLVCLEKGNREAYSHLVKLAHSSILSRDELIHLIKGVREIAEKGNVFAQEMYGLFLCLGWGVKSNQVQAVAYFRMAAQQNSAFGHLMYGIHAYFGIGMKVNHQQALDSFRFAAPKVAMARWYLALLLIRQTKLIGLLQNRYHAELEHGVTFDDSCEVSPLIRETIDSVRILADSGDPGMIYLYGFCRELGYGVRRDAEEAARLYAMIIHKLPVAQYRYSLCLRDGVGITQDIQMAMSHLKDAADGGVADAQYDLAICLGLGICGQIEETKSMEYFRRSIAGMNVNSVLAAIALNADFTNRIRPEMYATHFVAKESAFLYDRRVRGEDNQVGVVVGYPTGWTRFLNRTMPYKANQ